MGFCDGHIELFMEGINKNKQKKKAASDQLARWDIPQFLINNMNSEGYLDQGRWTELHEEALQCERNAEEKRKKDEEKALREFEEKYPSDTSKKSKKRNRKSKQKDNHVEMIELNRVQ
eukprot:749468_1